MKYIKTDVAVIGAGSAGLNAYRAARSAGKRAVLIESGIGGTTCARVGCMPSKLLIAAAQAAHGFAKAAEFGIHIDSLPRIVGTEVMARVKRERDRFVNAILAKSEAFPAEDKLKGAARFIETTVLQVDEHTQVQATSIVIATGSSPIIPPEFKVLGDRVIVTDDIFEWNDLPKSLAIFGAGAIGLELGQALARLGVHVKLFGHNNSLGGITDPELRDAAKAIFQKEFYLDLEAQVMDMKPIGEQAELRYRDLTGAECTERFDYVLVATGRQPNVKSLGLGKITHYVDSQGVPEFDRATMQIGELPIFVAGDADDDHMVLHEAAEEGRIAGENAVRFPHVRRYNRCAPLSIVFSDPQIALIGQHFKQLNPRYFVTGSADFSDQGRARIMLANQGLLHLYVQSSSGRLLGAEIVGPCAEHLGHLLAWALSAQLNITQMLEMPFYHPTIEEAIRTALREAVDKIAEV